MQAVHYFLSACNVPLPLPSRPPPAARRSASLRGPAAAAKRTSTVEACGVQLAQYLTPMHQLVMLLGAAVHDLGHTGRFGRL